MGLERCGPIRSKLTRRLRSARRVATRCLAIGPGAPLAGLAGSAPVASTRPPSWHIVGPERSRAPSLPKPRRPANREAMARARTAPRKPRQHKGHKAEGRPPPTQAEKKREGKTLAMPRVEPGKAQMPSSRPFLKALNYKESTRIDF